MRRLTLCLVLALTAAPAAATGLSRTDPASHPAGSGRVEAEAAKAQLDHDAFQTRILAAERRASASICVGCLAAEPARPAARPAKHAQIRTKPAPPHEDAGDDLR